MTLISKCRLERMYIYKPIMKLDLPYTYIHTVYDIYVCMYTDTYTYKQMWLEDIYFSQASPTKAVNVISPL